MTTTRRPRIITPARARRIVLRAQGLDGGWVLPGGAEGAATTVERLGYVQIDTIAVIARAHEHALWVRQPSYRPEMLHQLLAVDRRVFEYWTHAASYVPMSDYRYYLRRMHGHTERGQPWREENAKLVEHVRRRLRTEGALAAADFESGDRRGPWWDWKPAKRVLEHLFNAGELMISQRRNFQRVYDLTERVMPTGIDTSMPDPEEEARWAVRRALGNLGVVDLLAESRYRRGGSDERVAAAVAELTQAGEVVPVTIRGSGDGVRHATAEAIEATERGRRSRRVHLLSPFDNLVIRRRWLASIFDFDYTLECYLPERKRRHGYFCLPILWGDRFVGRLDPKAERKKRVFAVRRLAFEPDIGDWDALLPPLARKIAELARFNGCDRVRLYSVRPAAVRAPLRRALDTALQDD